MTVTLGPHVFEYPATPDELPLGAWIEFVRSSGSALDEEADEIDAMAVGPERFFRLADYTLERAYAVAAFFAGIDLEGAKLVFPATETLRLHREILPQVFKPSPARFLEWNGETLTLPEPELTQSSAMTFGEALDSKVMFQNKSVLKWTRWELIRALAAIFFRPESLAYDESFAYADSARVVEMDELPIGAALMVADWYERLNEFLDASFTVFQESNIKSGRNMKRHFERWGWVNFLKTIAEAKVFDIPGLGLNSIQCARIAKAYDVFVYASESKEYSEALTADLEDKKPKK